MTKRTVFFISDSTGITAKTLGQSVLSQFDNLNFDHVVIPYVIDEEKALACLHRIEQAEKADGLPPIIFDTVLDRKLNAILAQAPGCRFDILNTYLKPLEIELGVTSSERVGKAHGRATDPEYKDRIDAVHYAMENDDGSNVRYYDKADLILIGVSRCGKTPTSLYMALQYGLFTANYPITEDDMDESNLPKHLKAHRDKLFGLTIDPERLSVIRHERRADSRYASLRQCEYEVSATEAIYRRFGIPFINTTVYSIEEISAKILDVTGMNQHHQH